ncbi:MAG: hypothetical protein WA061_03910 [Microgenomates group bacterium]
MRIKTLLILLTFFVSALIFPIIVSAQSNAVVEKTVKCLKNRPEDKGNTASLTWHDPPTPQSLPKYLTGTFLPGSTVYTVACIGTGEGRRCGTGNKTLDDELFSGTVGLARGDYQINVTFNKPKQEVDNTGIINVDAVVGGTAANQGSYEFFGVEVTQKVDTTIPGQGALQQGVFKFIETGAQDCAKLSWTHHDPYGIVFDSVSLEPLGNVVVTINDETGKPLENNPVLFNKKPTLEDGVYNYLVPPGKYIMTVQVPTGYKFSATPKASANMATVYDFIDENDSKSHCTIYKPGEIIDEKADFPECRNIPLEPVSVAANVKDPVSILYSLEKDMDKEVYRITGKVSHPLATVIAQQSISATQKVELAKIESNHSGYYTLEIPLANVLPDAPMEVVFVKSTLMGSTQAKSFFNSILGFIVKTVNAQNKNVLVLDQLPTYVEGYAFDEKQQIIPNATVEVVLKNGGSTYYQAKADENGYFFIAPKNLPSSQLNLEFSLRFVKQDGKKVAYKIYEFTKANKYYFTKEGINLLTGMKSGKIAEPQPANETKLGIVPLTQKERAALQKTKTSSSSQTVGETPNSLEQAKSEQNKSMQQIAMVILFLVVLIVVGAVAVITALKKK